MRSRRASKALDWSRIGDKLSGLCHHQRLVLAPAMRRARRDQEDAPFCSRAIMARYGLGQRIQYFAYPLPQLVATLPTALYPPLAAIGNAWNELLWAHERYPLAHAAYLARCHAAGQSKPTPLLRRYGAGDFNCLHQDVYGEQVFPLQAEILLSEPGRHFGGGEFALTEQCPRMQSRAEVVPLSQGCMTARYGREEHLSRAHASRREPATPPVSDMRSA